MVLELLGPNLENMLISCNRSFSLTTIVLAAEQMLDLLEHVHARNFLHRDIKPENFAIGYKDKRTIYLLDFGLARRYINPKTKEHIPYKDNRNMTGTVRYASVNTHLGAEQSRRDDIESLLYVLVYFAKGTLPWQDIKAVEKKLKYTRVMEVKMTVPPEVLCKGMPSKLLVLPIEEFVTLFYYIKSLRFEALPDYEHIRDLLNKINVDIKLYNKRLFDWILPQVV
eukprot:TRINITY_DN7439_c0_g1_i10.p1 TRINITY_DN7439_c0_g1~~TRINITY_DN7439_c0_g1_i10.p1  ORF type:complete len:225 (+),score=50.62 TRINITY_DN7439_c0_g1_i10:371-1045(+)